MDSSSLYSMEGMVMIRLGVLICILAVLAMVYVADKSQGLIQEIIDLCLK